MARNKKKDEKGMMASLKQWVTLGDISICYFQIDNRPLTVPVAELMGTANSSTFRLLTAKLWPSPDGMATEVAEAADWDGLLTSSISEVGQRDCHTACL